MIPFSGLDDVTIRGIGGAMLPHASQFFAMPETEDRNTVERVETAAAEIGARLRALRPDLWVIFANIASAPGSFRTRETNLIAMCAACAGP